MSYIAKFVQRFPPAAGGTTPLAVHLPRILGPLLLLAAACKPVPVSVYHRETLDEMARRDLDCPNGVLEVSDITPEDFRYSWDPDAKRYRVEACGRSGSYLCYHRAELDTYRAECRSLERAHSGEEVHMGPWQVR